MSQIVNSRWLLAVRDLQVFASYDVFRCLARQVMLWSVLFPSGQAKGQLLPNRPLKMCNAKNPPPCADKAPTPTYNPDANYSREAMRDGIEGTVVLGAVVGTDGRAHDIDVLKPLGHGLDEEAVKSLQQWKFKPGQSHGNRVPVTIRVEISFHR
jgi:TonB family protein